MTKEDHSSKNKDGAEQTAGGSKSDSTESQSIANNEEQQHNHHRRHNRIRQWDDKASLFRQNVDDTSATSTGFVNEEDITPTSAYHQQQQYHPHAKFPAIARFQERRQASRSARRTEANGNNTETRRRGCPVSSNSKFPVIARFYESSSSSPSSSLSSSSATTNNRSTTSRSSTRPRTARTTERIPENMSQRSGNSMSSSFAQKFPSIAPFYQSSYATTTLLEPRHDGQMHGTRKRTAVSSSQSNASSRSSLLDHKFPGTARFPESSHLPTATHQQAQANNIAPQERILPVSQESSATSETTLGAFDHKLPNISQVHVFSQATVNFPVVSGQPQQPPPPPQHVAAALPTQPSATTRTTRPGSYAVHGPGFRPYDLDDSDSSEDDDSNEDDDDNNNDELALQHVLNDPISATVVIEGEDEQDASDDEETSIPDALVVGVLEEPDHGPDDNSDSADKEESPKTWNRRKRFCTLLVPCLLCLVGTMVVIPLLVVTEVRSSSPSSLSASSSPTADSSVLTRHPTSSPTLDPRSTSSPTPKPVEAFITNGELIAAVQEYLRDNSANTTTALTHGHPIGTWDVSQVQDFQNVFDTDQNPLAEAFNEDISLWDTSSATTMRAMFQNAANFNQPIGRWRMSRVTDASLMFDGASRFNAPIGDWDVSRILDASSMFFRADSFNQALNKWNVSSVTYMYQMFSYSAFNGPIESWNVARVVRMNQMFQNANAFNQDLSLWDMSAVTNLGFMFQGASAFNQNLCSWADSLPSNAQTIQAFAQTSCPDQTDTVVGIGPYCYSC